MQADEMGRLTSRTASRIQGDDFRGLTHDWNQEGCLYYRSQLEYYASRSLLPRNPIQQNSPHHEIPKKAGVSLSITETSFLVIFEHICLIKSSIVASGSSSTLQ